MPIIPRFASVQDPNTPPNVDFSQGIMQSALAGAQLRRMGVEEKQAEAESKRADARLGMQQDTLAFRKQAYQDSRDAQSEQAAVTGFFSGQSGLPADQAGPPSPFEAQELETRGAQAFRGSLKTPEAQQLFDQQYAGYLQNRQSEVRSQALQSKLQDTLMGAQQLPGAQPFLKSLEALGAQLDTIADPNLDPEARNSAMAKWSDDFQKIEEGIRKEQKRLEDTEAALGVIAAKLTGPAALPVGHPSRGTYQDVMISLTLGGDPEKAMEAMYAIDQGKVLDKPSGRWVPPDVAARLEDNRAQRKAIDDRMTAKAAAGTAPDMGDVVNLTKFIHESQFYTDKETGRPEPIDPTRVALNPVESFALAFAQLHPEAFAARIAESKEMQDAIDAEDGGTPVGSGPATEGGQTTGKSGGAPTGTPAPAKPSAASLRQRIATLEEIGLVPQEKIDALKSELATLTAQETRSSGLKGKYSGLSPIEAELRRRRAALKGAPKDAEDLTAYIDSEGTQWGDAARKFREMSDEDFSIAYSDYLKRSKTPIR